MRIIDCIQGTEEWDRWRLRPTASNFSRILTPAKLQLSAQAIRYARELVAREHRTHIERMPTDDMERGNELEPELISEYEKLRGVTVERVGFVLPDDTDCFGCSPDGFVIENGERAGLIEGKCQMPELFFEAQDLADAGEPMPAEFRPQVQGQLLITGLPWCDLVVYSPGYPLAVFREEANEKYQKALAAALYKFLEMLQAERKKRVLIPGWTPREYGHRLVETWE